ncbi:MAG: arylamine N-acetyltransferase family protein [Rhizobiaceae bacterium]
MNLQAYLQRIDYSGPLRVNRSTLNGLVAASLRSIPFENLNQQLGTAVSTDLNKVYQKLVIEKRGGWCFENNSLFKWALEEIGFNVSMLAGYVGEDQPDKSHSGDHMFLSVECDGLHLVDVGFGGGLYSPVPLLGGSEKQVPYEVSVHREHEGCYKYQEKADGNQGGYCFTLQKVTTSNFDDANHDLQTNPSSPFIRTLSAQRRLRDSHYVLRGLVLKRIDVAGTTLEILQSKMALVECLRNEFGLDVPEISNCWPRLLQRHKELFGQ